MRYSLEHVKKTYRLWGSHPVLYKLACILTFLGNENKLRGRAVELLALEKGDAVLDLACGTGLNFQYLENAVGPTGKIIAFDYSGEMLSAARQRAEKHDWNNILFVEGDAAKMPLEEKVDGLLSTLGVSAIPQHKEALVKSFDVLRCGKKISILDACLPSGVWKPFNPLIAHVYKHWAGWDYTKNIPEDLNQLVHDAKTEIYNGGTMYIVHGTKHVGKFSGRLFHED